MKTALIFFRTIERSFDGEYYGRVVSSFKSGGVNLNTVEILSNTEDHAFRVRWTELKDTVDNLIIVGGEDLSFNLKEIIADGLDTALAENENARVFLDAVSKTDGVCYPGSKASHGSSFSSSRTIQGLCRAYRRIQAPSVQIHEHGK